MAAKNNESSDQLSHEEQLKKIDAEYRGLKRMMTTGAIGVAILILGLVLRQPGGWVVAVVVLALIEGISYPLLIRSLDRRHAQRVADLNSQQ
jgi:hypothetical protein